MPEGFGMPWRSKDHIRTTEQVNAALATCQKLNLDGLVIFGGVTSHTDVALLAETFAEVNCSKKVVGVPVTFYGDLKNQFVEANVGFDTVCKCVRVQWKKCCLCVWTLEREKGTYCTYGPSNEC